jgi:glyoxylase-like metal-dependent hydrolase (beta-lactamase superfamily II)
VRSGEEGFVIDSPIYPHELEALPGVLEQAHFAVSGLLSTHADWDHLLGRLAFPGASLGVGESTLQRLQAEPGAAQRKLRAFDEEQYIEGRSPLALAGVQALPVPGKLSIGVDRELELHPTEGHTPDGTAFYIPWAATLVCGDYVSPVEIPWISEGGSLTAYQATLERLRPLIERAETVVPGHGTPLTDERALELLNQDLEYLESLKSGTAEARLPRGRATQTQKRIHSENLQHVGL